MERDAATDLVEYLSQTAGSYVRAAAIYDDDNFELLYIKDSVADSYREQDLDRIASRMRTEVRRSQAEGLYDLGDFRCSLWGFSEGIVLHFPQGGGEGTVVTLEAEAARQFNEFVEECAQYIYK